MIDKLVTGPLWRHLQLSSTSVLSMSKVYTKMKHKFEEWGEDAQTVVHISYLSMNLMMMFTKLCSQSQKMMLWYRNFCSFFLKVFLLLCNAFS